MRKFFALAFAFLALSAPARAAAAKVTKESFNFRDKKRTYYLYVPETVGAARPAPLVVLLHGSGRNGLTLVERWKDLADKEGLILAGPDSIDSSVWSIPADGPDFIRELSESLKSRLPVDPRRVYLFGHSGGATFALLLSLLESEYYAAAAVHAGALRPEDARLADAAKRKVPLAIQVGTQDPLFPLPAVRGTRELLEARGFAVELTEIAGHDHWYYDRAPEINRRAWEFLKRQGLSAEPRYERRAGAGGGGRPPKEAIDAYNDGLKRHRAGDLAGAVAAYTRALKAAPDFAEALANRGTAHLSLNDTASALADLTRSIEMAPSDALAHSNRGSVLRALKRPKEAVADYTKSLELKPSAETLYNRATVYEEEGQPDSALADYTQAVALDPKFAEGYAARGLILLRRGQDAEAQRDFDTAFRLKPELRAQTEPLIRNVRLLRETKQP